MNMCKKTIENFILMHSKLSIMIIYNAVTVGLGAVFYYVLPLMMGYPPKAKEVSKALGTSVLMQYVFIIGLTIVIGSIVLYFALKKVEKWQELLGESPIDIEQLQKVREKCVNIPYLIYISQVAIINIPIILMASVVVFLNDAPVNLVLRILITCFTFMSLVAVISHTFSKKIFTQILLKTYTSETAATGMRISIRSKLFLQILPMFLVAILFTGLIGYNRLIEEKGDMAYLVFEKILDEIGYLEDPLEMEEIFDSYKSLKFVEGIKVDYFIVNAKGEFISNDGFRPSAFFSYYLKHPVGLNKDRIYGDTNETQGVIRDVEGKQGMMKIGIKYELASPKTVLFFCITLVLLLILCIFVLNYFAKAFSEEIALVSRSLSEIAEGESLDLNKKIPVTSNDEVSDLVTAYNKITSREYEYDKLKNDFITNISHELRTPLNVILATVQLSETYLNKDAVEFKEKSVRNTKTIKQNSLRLLRLVNNLIDINKIEAGYLKLYMQHIDIVALTKSIVQSVVEYASARNVNLLFEADTEEKVIYCDYESIERILLNLLSNAIKFTLPDGNVTVKISDRGQKVLISVKDSGIGIPLDKQKLIFQRFRQVDESLTKSYEGSGIGLSLVKSLVDLLKGRISVTSEEGKGSEFTIELPEVLDDENGTPAGCNDKAIKADVLRRVNIELSDIGL